ncbi:MAG: hypothetical protein LLG05_07710 [Porphyromonadaceae bacterium]|nr:hypothetical protein [Porphyromonadaceae bacterium]
MSRIDTRLQTGDFLRHTQSTTSFHLTPQDQYYTDTTSSALTEVADPIIPMRIRSIGKTTNFIDDPIDFTLLMNPESWNHAKTNAYQTSYTRSGWLVQLWGPNQDTISSNGKTAAMINSGVGLDNFVQQTTFSYLNFISLVSAYKTNGCEFFDRLAPNLTSRVINRVFGVHIMYDGQEFMGHFSNFTMDEDDEHPYIFNYNFEFIISSLTGDETEIRGHYKKLPVAKEDPTISDQDTQLIITSDIYTKEPNDNIIPPRPIDDRTTQRLWEAKTGLPWSVALQYNLTDGSVQGNLILRNELYSKTWDPVNHIFT